jgi:pantoate--beta-alanine ligase
MKIFRNIEEYGAWYSEVNLKNTPIGFVPTMGALHKGHLSLIEASKRDNDYTVCSIFVNPTQFNDKADYDKYPRTLDDDVEVLEKQSCDVLFAPASHEMYPANGQRSQFAQINLGQVAEVMEGKFRPGHFDGVVTIVAKLFGIIKPNKAYFGQKDFQQLAIVRQMINELEMPVAIISCPTIREDDGLALSSRNLLLSPEQRAEAPTIYQSLLKSKEKLTKQNVNQIKQGLIDQINRSSSLDVEYVEIADSRSLQPIDSWGSAESAVCCVAVHAGDVRLIDNIILYN